jgi:glycosyltransferase involved in cell wall biosynthesis
VNEAGLKICLVNSFFSPYIGGIETYVSNLSKELVRRGNDVTLYCSSRGSTAGSSVDSGVYVHRFSTPLSLYGQPLGLFPRSFLTGDYDLIHCNFPNPYFAALSSWVGKTRGVPTVLTWHNDLPAVRPAASLLVGAHDYLATSYLSYYKTIIATTSLYAQKSRVLRRNARRVKVVFNGVDTRRFNPSLDGSSIRERFGLRDDYVVLFVGALTTWHSYKGVSTLISAFAKAGKQPPQTMRLLIVGDGDLLESYKALAIELHVDDRVHFAGRVDDDELPLFYAACDVAVLPSKDLSEGFGLVLLEAMACGKAVIGSAVGGIPELIQNGTNGLLVEPNDLGELENAIHTLSENEEVRRSMGAAGRSFAERHDWKLVVSQVESIYRNSLAR